MWDKEIKTYLLPDRVIDGLHATGRDVVTFFYGDRHFEIRYYDLNRISERVNEMLRKYNFWFVSGRDGELYSMPDWVIERAKKVAYQLAFREIVENQNVDLEWHKITSVINPDEIPQWRFL